MSEVLYTVHSGAARITIHRPEQRNALNPAVLAGLRARLAEAATDRNVRVITITGSGDRVFCAGAVLRASQGAEAGDAQDFGRSDFRNLLVEIDGSPKPTVALARGHVMAGGLGILLACDLALACDDIHFSTPEVHVGMFPMMVLALLFRNVGRKKATELMFLGERISATQTLECGMVNHVYARAEFDAAAEAMVAKLAAKSGRILRLGKEAMRATEDLPLPEALEQLEAALARLMETNDSREGIRAFLEKRPPRWTDT